MEEKTQKQMWKPFKKKTSYLCVLESDDSGGGTRFWAILNFERDAYINVRFWILIFHLFTSPLSQF